MFVKYALGDYFFCVCVFAKLFRFRCLYFCLVCTFYVNIDYWKKSISPREKGETETETEKGTETETDKRTGT